MSDTLLATSTARLIAEVFAALKLRSTDPPGRYPITLLQIRALSFLSEIPRTVGDLARHLGTTVGSASSLVARLVKDGYVRREQDPTDRRQINCVITSKGRRVIERFWTPRITGADLQNLLSHAQLVVVADAMRVLADALGVTGLA